MARTAMMTKRNAMWMVDDPGPRRPDLPIIGSMPGVGDRESPVDFVLPADLEASAPPEARGLARDQVRLMVSREDSNAISHARFRDLPDFLSQGDLVVVNTSGTRNAAVSGLRPDGTPVVAHLSSRMPDGRWIVEIRKPEGNATGPFTMARAGDIHRLPHGATVTLIAPYRAPSTGPVRLWESEVRLGANVTSDIDAYLSFYGRPIRYKYVDWDWPSEYYQTVYADEIGSAEMPSAGRGFTENVLHRLCAMGVEIAPLILHTGVASLETHEPPYDEYYRVPEATAAMVNETHRRGGRVIAVGTTVVRALETVTQDGVAHAGEGWTDLVITPERGIQAVDGLITGLHEPQATHLLMLLSMASQAHLRRAYRAALDERYLWHEFGDLHLLLRK